MSAAGALLLTLVTWFGIRVAGAHQFAAARNRFELEVGALPAPGAVMGAAGGEREKAFVERLGGPVALDANLDLPRVRQFLGRAPSTWSAEEADRGRAFLAANASLLAACERAAGRRRRAANDSGGGLPWEPTDINQLWQRASEQSALLRARIGLGLRERSLAQVSTSMEALAAEVEAFQGEPGLFQGYELVLEKWFLQTTAWVAAERDVESRDLAAMRQLLPHRPAATTIRCMFAGEAGYLLAINATRGRALLSAAEAAEVLDGYRRLALALARTAVTGVAVRVASAGEPPAVARHSSLPRAILAQTQPNLEAFAEQIAATAAARQLGELALDLRLAATRGCAYPEALDALPLAGEPDPLTGRRPTYRREAGGGALLANASAAAAWRALPHCASIAPPPFVWRLPPPCAREASEQQGLATGGPKRQQR